MANKPSTPGSQSIAPELRELERWLGQATGLEAALLGPRHLERAVSQRCRHLGVRDPRSYAALLQGDTREQQELLERLVVAESWFLREPQAFTQLVAHASEQSERPLRVLSCGCASGEEPYSVLIALLEAGWRQEQLQVEAIDLSEQALARAAEGHYGSHALRGLERQHLDRYFDPGSGSGVWRLRPTLRSGVRFHQGALLLQLAALPGDWHALLCRNVMIYLQPEARCRLLELIAARLAPGALLQVAIAEAPIVPDALFERCPGVHGASFRRRLGLEKPEVPEFRTPLPMPASAPVRASLEPSEHLAGARRLKARGRHLEALAALRRCLYLDPHHLEALELRLALALELGPKGDAARQRQRLDRARKRRGP